MMQAERIPPVPPSQVGFITVPVNCWSSNSEKVSRLKDRVWLHGSSAQSAISLPLILSGSCVGLAGPISGRRHLHDQMQDTTHHDRLDQDGQQLHYTTNGTNVPFWYNGTIHVSGGGLDE